ncbi:MAG: hypothetical protein JSS09_01685 [Verrucomicrobia bacterium]|nr:hypothetical protein [Verrucomicrobiota bacterium]
MASANFTLEEKAFLAKKAAEIKAKIDEASEKETQNYAIITELAKNILDLGGIVPPFEEPIIKGNQRLPLSLSRRLDCLQLKNQWLEKKIQEYGELVARLKNR